MANSRADAESSRKGEGLTFLIVDDHPLVCEALSIALSSELGAGSTRMTHSLGEALELLDSGFKADAVLLDLNLPDVQGFDGLLRRAEIIEQIVESDRSDILGSDQAQPRDPFLLVQRVGNGFRAGGKKAHFFLPILGSSPRMRRRIFSRCL